ncbi:11603_t:CDS:1, partial [Rhizophagus irregularis]
ILRIPRRTARDEPQKHEKKKDKSRIEGLSGNIRCFTKTNLVFVLELVK